MHYSILVIVDEPTDERIAEVMEPYGGGREWDWYQVGGRWTGLFDGYNPDADEENVEVCSLCSGTGKRPDMECVNGCNGCEGRGKRVKWPTQWKRHAGDIIAADKLTDEHVSKFYAICTESGWHGGEEYQPWAKDEKFKKRDQPPLGWLREQGAWAVVVDCHN